MRLVEERSLSSILRSNLLTTLINNDVSAKPNASGGANALNKFHATQTWFAPEAADRPSLYNVVPKREGATLVP